MAFPFSIPTSLKPFSDLVEVWLHGRRVGVTGDGQQSNTVNATSSLLVLDGVPVGSTRTGPPPLPFLATGLSAAGAVTLTGAVVGDIVFKVFDQNSATWTDVTSSFESAITVAGQIQETASVTGHPLVVYLQAGS